MPQSPEQLNCLFFRELYHTVYIKDHDGIQEVRAASSNQSIPGRTSKLTDRDRRSLKRIVGRKHQTTAAKVAAELNQSLNSPVSTKAVLCELN